MLWIHGNGDRTVQLRRYKTNIAQVSTHVFTYMESSSQFACYLLIACHGLAPMNLKVHIAIWMYRWVLSYSTDQRQVKIVVNAFAGSAKTSTQRVWFLKTCQWVENSPDIDHPDPSDSSHRPIWWQTPQTNQQVSCPQAQYSWKH